MKNREKEFEWDELRDIWISSPQTRDIHIQMSEFLDEAKGKVSQFEKDSVKSDLAALKTSWAQFKGMASQFEKESVKKDLNIIAGLLKKFLNLFKKES